MFYMDIPKYPIINDIFSERGRVNQMKKVVIFIVVLIAGMVLYSVAESGHTSGPATVSSKSNYSDTSSHSYTSSYSSTSKSFSNKYGTPTTYCAHSGCTNYIASSGDTNCCIRHSNRCYDCNCYIDEDAMLCMSCIRRALGK